MSDLRERILGNHECRHPDDDSPAWPCAHVEAIGRALGEVL